MPRHDSAYGGGMSLDLFLARVPDEYDALWDPESYEEYPTRSLGSRAEVIAELSRLFPEADETGRWTNMLVPLEGGDFFYVTIPEKPSVTLVTIAEGTQEVMDRLAPMRRTHGWRLFLMGTGEALP
jgi:hypothetical protein